MINYPDYMRDPFQKKLFKRAVFHRLLMENENPICRAKRHAFKAGEFIGMLEMCKSTFWRSKHIQEYVYEEAKRLWLDTQEVKP